MSSVAGRSTRAMDGGLFLFRPAQSFILARHLNDSQKQAKPAHRFHEFVVFDRLGNVAAAAEVVTVLDFARVVGCGQHDHGDLRGLVIGLELRSTSIPSTRGMLMSSKRSRGPSGTRPWFDPRQ